MAYIIENAHVLKGQAVKKTSMLIHDGRITALKPSFTMYKHIRMDADAYIMTPTHVLLDYALPLNEPFQKRKEYYLNHFIRRGCTAALIIVKIQFEQEFEKRMKQAKSSLTDSPIDYVIAISIPPTLLTPGLIRKCKRERIPAIFLEISDIHSLYSIQWGWVKEATFPYNSPIIPVFKGSDGKKKTAQVKAWKELSAKEKILSADEEIRELLPIPERILKLIGIIPHKSYLNWGSEISYNLYHKTEETLGLDQEGLFSSQSASLAVTVHKDTVIRAGEKVYYRPGKGENVIIKIPGFFKDH